MRKTIFTIITTLLVGASVYAQDVIIKRNGEEINAKVFEITQSEIRYKRFDNQTGPTFILPISDIFMIQYENGVSDVFTVHSPAIQSNPNIRPGMRYNELRNIYDTRLYTPQIGDAYNPALAGVASFLLPGLGQMISGEVGRGVGQLVGTFGCYFVVGLGIGISTAGHFNTPTDNAGSVLIAVGIIGGITVQIFSIIDAVHVAKVRNMYMQDLRKMSTGIEFKLLPYAETISIGNRTVIPVGLSLVASF